MCYNFDTSRPEKGKIKSYLPPLTVFSAATMSDGNCWSAARDRYIDAKQLQGPITLGGVEVSLSLMDGFEFVESCGGWSSVGMVVSPDPKSISPKTMGGPP